MFSCSSDGFASAGAGGRAVYEPTRSVREAARKFVPRLAAALLDPGRDLLDDDVASLAD